MELKYSKVVNRELKKTEMFLYGPLGDQAKEIDGHYFAQEMHWLGRNYDEITVRINSEGGDVLHGLSIVSEMMASKAYVIAKVDGVAASMSAVLLVAADKVVMNDYARVMIHSPYYVDEKGDAVSKLTEKEKKGLANIKDILNTLLGKRGIETTRIVELMKTDSWFDAESALAEKLVDEINVTGRKAELVALEPAKLVAALSKENIQFNINNLKSMKRIAVKFGLAEDASEEVILAKVAEVENAGTTKMVDQLVSMGRTLGTVTDENVEKVKRLAKADFELAAEMYLTAPKTVEAEAGDEGTEPVVKTTKATLIKDAIDKGKAPAAPAKKFDELTAAEIETMRVSNKAVYVSLFKAHYGFEPTIEN